MTRRVVIVGGGIVGTAICYHLTLLGHRDVTLLEAESGLGEGATAKATGGVRQQFTSEINCRLVRRSTEMFHGLSEQTGMPFSLRQHGYLFLLDSEEGLRSFTAAAEMQQRLGIPTEVLTPEEVARRFPDVRTDDLHGATYCATDGSASPADALACYAAGARRGGARFRLRSAVTGFVRNPDGAVTGVRCGDEVIEAEVVVLAPGPWARNLAALAGVELPVSPRRRQAFALASGAVRPDRPLTVDMGTGAYLHPEAAGSAIVGGSDRDVPEGLDTKVDWDVVPRLVDALMHRFPGLDDARISRGWAGVREMTPDDHAVVGPVDDAGSLWVAAGFSGHGFMQAPAIAEAVAARLLGVEGGVAIDELSPDRFRRGEPIIESVLF